MDRTFIRKDKRKKEIERATTKISIRTEAIKTVIITIKCAMTISCEKPVVSNSTRWSVKAKHTEDVRRGNYLIYNLIRKYETSRDVYG